MTIETLVFYFFATLMVIGALGVVLLNNSVQAVLSLVFTFFCAAIIWLLLEAEFLAISLVLVYVGAVMVLFLFVVMMLDLDRSKPIKKHGKQLLFGLVVAIILFIGLYLVLRSEYFGLQLMPTPAKHSLEYSNVAELGKLLYNDYFYAFEIAGVILLVAIVAAISLTFRGRLERRGQSIPGQHKVTKEDRLRVVKVEAELTAKENTEKFEQERQLQEKQAKEKSE